MKLIIQKSDKLNMKPIHKLKMCIAPVDNSSVLPFLGAKLLYMKLCPSV